MQGLADAQDALSGIDFKVLGSTQTTDARDHTETNGENGHSSYDGEGEPIYYYLGEKVADGYDDFYDGDWDSQSPRYETGALTPSHNNFWVMTGSDPDGTEGTVMSRGRTLKYPLDASGGLNATFNVGRPGGRGQELECDLLDGCNLASSSRRLYALSEVLTVPTLPVASVNIGGERTVTVPEGNVDGERVLTVVLTPAPTDTVTVMLSLGGTATPGAPGAGDYCIVAGIGGCATSPHAVAVSSSGTAEVAIGIDGDTVPELDETIVLTVVSGTGYLPATNGTQTATLTLEDDDTDPAPFHLDIDGNGGTEALTDGLLILRVLLRNRDPDQVSLANALGRGAMRTTPTAIVNYINTLLPPSA